MTPARLPRLLLGLIVVAVVVGMAVGRQTRRYVRESADKGFVAARAPATASRACDENRRAIEAALRLFAHEHPRDVPNLAALIAKGYLRTMPTCPDAQGRDYTATAGASAGVGGGAIEVKCPFGHGGFRR